MPRPILFSASMVRALLAGTKTQTRRIVKGAPSEPEAEAVMVHGHLCFGVRSHPGTTRETFHFTHGEEGERPAIRCPYGVPGDALWAKHRADLFPVYFKPIPGWEGLYAASTDGLIYRMDGGEPRPLKGTPSSEGYLCVSLSDGVAHTKSVHTLVCETFYGAAPMPKAQARHMDGVQTNNVPQNLDWGTQEQNWQDRRAHGHGTGAAHPDAKLTPTMVEEIRTSLESQRLIAKRYGVSQATIWRVKSGAGWSDQQHEVAPRNTPAFALWRSPLFMPRWASRLTLQITDVRVERLNEISEADALAEGMTFPEAVQWGNDPKDAYRTVWENINGLGSWAANPWVWAVSFEIANAPVSA